MSKIKNKVLLITLFIVIILVTTACSKNDTTNNNAAVEKNEKTILKLGHALPDGHPIDVSTKEFARIVKERSNGTLEIQVFPQSQLGNEKDMLEGLTLGTLDMGALVGGPYGYLQPEYEVLSLVYLFNSIEQAEKALNSDVCKELADKLLENKGVRILHPFWYYGTRNLTANKKIINADDLKGLKVRVPEVPIQKEGLSAMGAQATPVDFGELYMALKTGVVDAQENPYSTTATSNFNQVQKYLINSKHIISAYMISINEKKFQGLTTEQQEILIEVAEEVSKYNNKLTIDGEEEQLQELKDRGMEVIEPDLESFIDAVKPLHEEYDKKYNGLVTKLQNAAK